MGREDAGSSSLETGKRARLPFTWDKLPAKMKMSGPSSPLASGRPPFWIPQREVMNMRGKEEKGGVEWEGKRGEKVGVGGEKRNKIESNLRRCIRIKRKY